MRMTRERLFAIGLLGQDQFPLPRPAKSINGSFVFDPNLVTASAQVSKRDDLRNGTDPLQASHGRVRKRVVILGRFRIRLFAHGNKVFSVWLVVVLNKPFSQFLL